MDKMREDAIREAARNHAGDEYFNADRAYLLVSPYSGRIFDAGFDRGWQAAKSAAVPVVGEPTDAAYKWLIAHGVEPMASLHKLGKRLAGLLDEDQFAECELLLLTAITAINTFVPVPAAELATLREKAAEADELRKKLAAYDRLNKELDAAIAGEKK